MNDVRQHKELQAEVNRKVYEAMVNVCWESFGASAISEEEQLEIMTIAIAKFQSQYYEDFLDAIAERDN